MGPGCDQQAPHWQLVGSSGYKDREKKNVVCEHPGKDGRRWLPVDT